MEPVHGSSPFLIGSGGAIWTFFILDFVARSEIAGETSIRVLRDDIAGLRREISAAIESNDGLHHHDEGGEP